MVEENGAEGVAGKTEDEGGKEIVGRDGGEGVEGRGEDPYGRGRGSGRCFRQG